MQQSGSRQGQDKSVVSLVLRNMQRSAATFKIKFRVLLQMSKSLKGLS